MQHCIQPEQERLQQNAEYRNRVFGQWERPTEVPENIVQQLGVLLGELERTTKCAYALQLRQAGSTQPFVMCGFETRSGFTVSDAREGYEALNGVYTSIIALKETIMRLKYGDMLMPDLRTWQCPSCGKCDGSSLSTRYNRTYRLVNIASTSVNADMCQFCSHSFHSIWNRIQLNLESGEIYTSLGGSISECRPIAKITVSSPCQ